MRPSTIAIVTVGLAGTLFSVPAQARSGQTATAVVVEPVAPAKPVAAIPIGEANQILRKWGIAIDGLRLTASGYMLDFRYRVLDARKARPLFERKTKPVLRDEATGAVMSVPVPPKTGALRNSNDPKAGKGYFMFFANPGRFLKARSRVTISIGEFSVSGIQVASDVDAVGEATE
jgi:hypothetical protein